MNQWKVGDWCFFKFKLGQIQEIQDGRITSVSIAFIDCRGYDLSSMCVSLTPANNNTSCKFHHMYDRLHREGSRDLNFPDLLNWLAQRWVTACCCGDEVRAEITQEVSSQVTKILDLCRDRERETVDGVRVFGKR